VVAILRGSDPELSHEYVALGAHSDHLGYSQHPAAHDSMRLYNQIARPGGAEDAKERATPEQIQRINEELNLIRARDTKSARPDSIFNGADDDGSGSAALLEIAQYYASLTPRPRRSILFVWHVGEEEGMLGSNYFTAHTTVPRESIVAQLNVDMIGRGDSSDRTGTDKAGSPLSGSSSYLQLIGSRRLSSELGDIVEAVNKTQKLPFAFDYSLDADGHPEMIYCRSDHYEYARFGIPIVFFSTGGHADYHQVTDEPQYIDYEHYLRVTRLIADVGRVVANLDHRPRVDKQVASGSACVQ
jgi:Zn-dependent M28 family amino/carboxypeptidase